MDIIINQAAEERKDWIDERVIWGDQSNYGKHYGLKHKQGVILFGKERLRIN